MGFDFAELSRSILIDSRSQMAEEIRLWRIENQTQLKSLSRSKLDLEERIEEWLDNDISVLADDLLVINRQTQTAFGGVIDLVCLDRAGDVVIVELKRHKTPRDITAQVLDYASWVRDLSRESLVDKANEYLAKRKLNLEEAFRKKFDSDLPDTLNENHRMLIVASQIDASSERIIKYLSNDYGVDINAATFHYFKTDIGEELLARIFLIEPETLEYKVKSKAHSKKKHITYDELEEQADQAGVGEIYRHAVSGISQVFSRHTTPNSLAFSADFDGSKKTVMSLRPSISTAESGLHFQIYLQKLQQHLKVTEREVVDSLPNNVKPWKAFSEAGLDYSGFEGFFIDQTSIDKFLRLLGKDKA